jgi:hypothetical protein
VRHGILSDEFIRRFVIGKSDETLVRTLYDVLLARAGDADGLEFWGKEVGLFGWENVVDRVLTSGEYNNSFGDDAVPGNGRAGCDPLMPSQLVPSGILSEAPSLMPSNAPSVGKEVETRKKKKKPSREEKKPSREE